LRFLGRVEEGREEYQKVTFTGFLPD